MKKRIKIIGTGGTIASVHDAELGFRPKLDVQSLLSYIPKAGEYYDIELVSLLGIDSANMQPEHWLIIAQAICEALNDDEIHGIVVTHGTDTMALTSAAIGLLIPDINKPVVFTGSQIPLDVFSSDARRNLIDSIRVAGETDIAESVIVFNSRIYRGVRTVKLREYDLSAFETRDPTPIGEIARTINIIDHKYRKSSPAKTPIQCKVDLGSKVAILKVFPGMDPRMIEDLLGYGYEGLVIEGYGAGNLPIQDRSLLPAINKVCKEGMTVIITTVCIFGKAELFLYETGRSAIKAGAISGYDMISEVAMIKLMWALGKTKDKQEVMDLMYTPLAGEINPEFIVEADKYR